MMKKIYSQRIRIREACGVSIFVVAMIIRSTQMLAISGITASRFFAHTIEIKMDHASGGKILFVSETIIARRMDGAMENLIV
jgi:hypothetical protein